jgi:hypothetical protein
MITSGGQAVIRADAVGVEIAINTAAKRAVVAAEMKVLVPNDTVDQLNVAVQAFINLPLPTAMEGVKEISTVQALGLSQRTAKPRCRGGQMRGEQLQ